VYTAVIVSVVWDNDRQRDRQTTLLGL